MHNVKKNQIVVVLLVVMIVVAGYLNYRTGDEMPQAYNDEDVTAEGVLLPEEMEESGDTNGFASIEEITESVEEGEMAEIGETAEIGDAASAQTQAQLNPEEETEARQPGEAIMVESDAVVPEYFAQAKVERENARAKSQDILYELMAKEDTPEEEKSQAAQKILELQKRIENEAAAEAMIKAKGFDEVYVRIYDECVDVIVDRQEISQQEAAQIQDILTRITGLGADKIRVSLLKIGA
ncbi:MAG: SpoIIIAH-like family protein [Firmicutes bacterium]|nr:SpoIIIAH-like family protein [Bacillota bacterium]